jgi:HSP20 family protein
MPVKKISGSLEEAQEGILVGSERRMVMKKLTTWDPFRDLEDMLDRYSVFSQRIRDRRLRTKGELTAWTPSADISETAGEYLIKADLPGVKKEDVKVSLGDGFITLSGERKEEKQAKGENQIRVERFYGQFSRTFSLPEDVDAGAVSAKDDNGTLTIHIPKKKGAKPKAVAIPVK